MRQIEIVEIGEKLKTVIILFQVYINMQEAEAPKEEKQAASKPSPSLVKSKADEEFKQDAVETVAEINNTASKSLKQTKAVDKKSDEKQADKPVSPVKSSSLQKTKPAETVALRTSSTLPVKDKPEPTHTGEKTDAKPKVTQVQMKKPQQQQPHARTYGSPKTNSNVRRGKDASGPTAAVKNFTLAPASGHYLDGRDDEPSSSEQSAPSHYGDESDDSYWFTSEDEEKGQSGDEEYEDDPEEAQYKASRLCMFAAYTHYNVIKEVAKFTFDYHLTKKEFCNWDLYWCDGPIGLRLIQRMQAHQRTNHFPGIYNLAKKNMLGRHLMKLQSVFPDEYNFFPPTFILPQDFKEFLNQIGNKRNRTFIVKPEASCQGKGIFLTRNPEQLTTEKTIHTTQTGVVEHMVVQRYMHKPYLIDGYKFDLRLYVLINGMYPLRIYIYEDGLARFATVKYQSPAPSNLNNLCMHLTNYAINKESANYEQNLGEEDDSVGSKRSYAFVLSKVKDDFGEQKAKELKEGIDDIIIKTMCLAQPHVHHLFRSCQPDDVENAMCFQILGFDIMIDHKARPYLIEVNQMPSFCTDSPLDQKIKKGVINDTLAILNLSTKRRNRTINAKKMEMQRRLLKGHAHQYKVGRKNNDQESRADDGSGMQKSVSKHNLVTDRKDSISMPANRFGPAQSTRSPPPKTLVQQNKDEMRKKKRLQREKQEKERCGAMELVYPLVSYKEEEAIALATAELQQKQAMQQKIAARNQRAQAIEARNSMPPTNSVTLDENPQRSEINTAEKNEEENKNEQDKIRDFNTAQNPTNSNSNEKPANRPQKSQLFHSNLEHQAITELMEEEENAINFPPGFEEQGQSGGPAPKTDSRKSLLQRWQQQKQYEAYMEQARKMWDQFAGGPASVAKNKRLKRKAEEEKKKQEEDKEKERIKKEQARKSLSVKLRKQAEERRQRALTRAAMMEQIEEENNGVQPENKSNESVEGDDSEDDDRDGATSSMRKQKRESMPKKEDTEKFLIQENCSDGAPGKATQGGRSSVRVSGRINVFEGSQLNELEGNRNREKRRAGEEDKRKSSNSKPVQFASTDYYKHIKQKYQMRQEELKKQQNIMIDAARQVKELQESTASNMDEASAKGPRSDTATPEPNEKEETKQGPKFQQPKMTDFPLDHILPVFNIAKHDQFGSQKHFHGAKKMMKGQLSKANLQKAACFNQPKTIDAERGTLVGPSPIRTTTLGQSPTPTMSKVTIGYTPIQSASKAPLQTIGSNYQRSEANISQANLINTKEYEAYSQAKMNHHSIVANLPKEALQQQHFPLPDLIDNNKVLKQYGFGTTKVPKVYMPMNQARFQPHAHRQQVHNSQKVNPRSNASTLGPGQSSAIEKQPGDAQQYGVSIDLDMLMGTENKAKEETGKNTYQQMFMSPQIDSKNRNIYNDSSPEIRPLDLANQQRLVNQHSKSVSGVNFGQNGATFMSQPYQRGSKLGELVGGDARKQQQLAMSPDVNFKFNVKIANGQPNVQQNIAISIQNVHMNNDNQLQHEEGKSSQMTDSTFQPDEDGKVRTQNFNSQKPPVQLGDFAKSVNLERNHLPSIKMPSAGSKHLDNQASGSTLVSTNAARVRAQMRMAKAQARAEDSKNVFASLKNSREHLEGTSHSYSQMIHQYGGESTPAQNPNHNPAFDMGMPLSAASAPVTSDGIGSKRIEGPLDHIMSGFTSGAPSLRRQKEILAGAGYNPHGQNNSTLSRKRNAKDDVNGDKEKQLDADENIFTGQPRGVSMPAHDQLRQCGQNDQQHNFVTNIASAKRQIGKVMQDQLNRQMRGRTQEVKLIAQGHSRAAPMKAFGSSEWETSGSIKAQMRVDSTNAMHQKRISEAEALQQFRRTGNVDSQGYPQNHRGVQYAEYEMPASFDAAESTQKPRIQQDAFKGAKKVKKQNLQNNTINHSSKESFGMTIGTPGLEANTGTDSRDSLRGMNVVGRSGVFKQSNEKN